MELLQIFVQKKKKHLSEWLFLSFLKLLHQIASSLLEYLKRSPAFEGHQADPRPIKKCCLLELGSFINNSIC